jgi:hypothetical protein
MEGSRVAEKLAAAREPANMVPICFESVAVSSDGLRLHGRVHHAFRFRGSD